MARGQAWGWRIYLDYEGELATFCPDCAERELGEDDFTLPFFPDGS